tara:strand:- start:3104 stop:3451 length:348 start_codon:yes stop_codon:yes gene_type:complete
MEDSVEDDNIEYEEITSQCDSLINSETINKEEALKILKLFHSAEKKFLEMMFLKQKEVDSLKNELIIIKLTNKNTEMLQQLSQDLLAMDKTVKDLVNDVSSLNSHVSHIMSKTKR